MKKPVFITRREHFNAAHRLFRADYTDEQNEVVFGKCSNPQWHGHNYELWVTVVGEIDNETGFVMNLKELSKIIQEHIIEKIDHRNMNLEVDFMLGKLASAEVLALSIFEVLEPLIGTSIRKLHSIKIKETENNYVEYFG